MSSKLLFARLKFQPKITHWDSSQNTIQREKETLLNVISWDIDINANLAPTNRRYLIKNNVQWKFGGINSEKGYIFGRLAKMKGHVRLIEDEKNKDFKQDLIKEANICNFLIDVKNHIIVYESKKYVGPKAPIEVISGAFNNYYKNSEEISFTLIKDRREIIKRINELDAITTIKLVLSPSNPHSGPTSKKMDTFLKNLKASRMNLEISSDSVHKGGIDLHAEDGFLSSGIRLAEEGYGNAQVKGVPKDKTKKQQIIIKSVNLPIFVRVELTKDDEKNIKLLKEKIFEILLILSEE